MELLMCTLFFFITTKVTGKQHGRPTWESKSDLSILQSGRVCEITRYLEQNVRGVVKQHDQGADANVVGTVGETQQEDGGQMVDHLFSKILVKQT